MTKVEMFKVEMTTVEKTRSGFKMALAQGVNIDAITASNEAAYAFLKEKRVIMSRPPLCPEQNCVVTRGPNIGQRTTMTLVKRAALSDGVVWRCPKHKATRISIRYLIFTFLPYSFLLAICALVSLTI